MKPLGVEPADDAAVAEERVRAHSERPRGIAELGLGLVERRALSVADALEVPPAAPIAREDEISRRAPLRLPDRLDAVLARDVLDVRDGAVGSEVRDVELAAVPRHPREIPGEEAEPRSVRRDARCGVEVATADDHARLGGPVRRQDDELVHDVLRAVALGVSLAHADPEGAVRSDAPVGVAVPPLRHLGGDRHGLRTRIDAVQALVVEVRHERDALVDAVRAAAVLVHRRSHVEVFRDDVDSLAVRIASHEDDPAGLGRAPLEPPGDAVLQPRRGQPDTGVRHHLRGDRRRPRSVRGDGLLTHLGLQRRRLWYCAMRPTREQAWQTLTQYTSSEALLRHALAVEASVGFYARLYGEDEELWRATALLHDFDYEIHPTLDKHPQDGAPILREEGYPEELIEAVLSHAEHLAMPRDTQLKKVLFACDELSGFVHACGLVRPTGLDGLEPKSVRKKLKQPSFAAGVHRDEVYAGAELLGLELDEHITNVVAAMQPIAAELGLRTAADAA